MRLNPHMYTSVKERGCCVVNIPSKEIYLRCIDTIKNNGFNHDEIALSGLTAVGARMVDAPMISECMVNLECELAWERDLVEGGFNAVMCFRVVNVWMDDRLFDERSQGRYGENGYLYNIHSPQNPLTGEAYETYVGVLSKLAAYEEL